MTEKEKYIQQKLTFTEDKLLDGDLAVMMGWENPLMKRSAEIICQNGGDILNIGFGLGIIDQYIQDHDINSHTIIECHPDVLSKMKEWGWYNKEGVKIIEGFWQDHIDSLPKFDGVYFDTWREQDRDVFQKNVHKIIKKGGILSFFNPSETNKETSFLNEFEYGNLSPNFHISYDLIDLCYQGDLKELEQYWSLDKKNISIPICIRK